MKMAAALVLAGIIVTGASFAVLAEWRRGPFFCASCELRNPMPDPATRAAIDRNLAPIDRVLGQMSPIVMVVCNVSACVDYRQTLTGRWEGSNARRMQSGIGGGEGGQGSGGGSGGGEMGGGSGGGGGGGCCGGDDNDGGTVTVGKVTKKK